MEKEQFFKDGFDNEFKTDFYQLKQMFADAEFTKQGARKGFNCNSCQKPVFRPRKCLEPECEALVCEICYAEGIDTCPNQDCTSSSFYVAELGANMLQVLAELDIRCTKQGCPDKGVIQDYDQFLKSHSLVHFGPKSASCPLLCGAALTEEEAQEHCSKCCNTLHHNPHQQGQHIIISHQKCQDEIKSLKE